MQNSESRTPRRERARAWQKVRNDAIYGEESHHLPVAQVAADP